MSEDKLYTLIASLYKRGMSVVTTYSIRACSSSANCSSLHLVNMSSVFLKLIQLHLCSTCAPVFLQSLQLHIHKITVADLVILGCGLYSQMVPPKLQKYFQDHNIAYEAIDTVC